MSKMYDNLISTAIKSINIVDNTVIITYYSNKEKEYTFNCENVQEFEDSLCKELISVEMKTGGSVGKFIHNQVKERLIVESK
tara:strand:- start:2550 stop:2795 length:246 start_codon:yes stop_codon:yes gene_type:complete